MVKKIILIIAALLAISGTVILIATSGVRNDEATMLPILDVNDPDSFCVGAHGIVCVPQDEIMPVDQETLCAFLTLDDDTNVVVPLTGLDVNRFYTWSYTLPMNADGELMLQVSISEGSQEQRERIIESIHSQYERTYEYILSLEDSTPEEIEYWRELCSDEMTEMMSEGVLPYELNVENKIEDPTLKIAAIVMIITGTITAVIILLSFKFSAKAIILMMLVSLIIFAAVCYLILRRKIDTVSSIKEYVPGVYTMRYESDYKLDEMLASGISTENDLLSWTGDELLYGIRPQFVLNNFGCSSCYVTTPEGHHLMGRNYDFPETDCMVICCDPSDGYASIGMVDLGTVRAGSAEGDIDPESAEGRLLSMVYPYLTVDGMNEAGVGVSILMLDSEEIHQDNGKPDLLMNVAIRAILDTCASTDEAVDLLSSYDIHSMIDSSFHLYIADAAGNAVVVEWFGNDMVVTKAPAVTNCYNDPAYYEHNPEEEPDDRFAILTDAVTGCSGIATSGEAMGFLAEVSYDNADGGTGTEWSCVYDLDCFEVTVCFDTRFDQVYTISPDTIR